MNSIEVFLIAATTADGFISHGHDDRSTDWTSPEDLQFYIEKIKTAQVVIMGSKTFVTINKFPKGVRIVVWSRQKNIEVKENLKDRVGFSDLSPQDLIAKLKAEGVERVAVAGGQTVYSNFMAAGVVNRLYISVEPVIFGTGLNLFNQPINQKLNLVAKHELTSQTTVMEYTVNNP